MQLLCVNFGILQIETKEEYISGKKSLRFSRNNKEISEFEKKIC